MIVINKNSESRFYHIEDCLFVKKIAEKDRMVLSEEEASKIGYYPCGCITADCPNISYQEKPSLPPFRGLTYDYDPLTNDIYVGTSAGFWKMMQTADGLWIPSML